MERKGREFYIEVLEEIKSKYSSAAFNYIDALQVVSLVFGDREANLSENVQMISGDRSDILDFIDVVIKRIDDAFKEKKTEPIEEAISESEDMKRSAKGQELNNQVYDLAKHVESLLKAKDRSGRDKYTDAVEQLLDATDIYLTGRYGRQGTYQELIDVMAAAIEEIKEMQVPSQDEQGSNEKAEDGVSNGATSLSDISAAVNKALGPNK